MRRLELIAAVLTLIGVPVGMALTGGTVEGVMTGTLAVTLALLVLFARRWPLVITIVSVLCVAGQRGSDLLGAGWAWPATAAFVLLVLDGRLRAAIITAGATLVYGLQWDAFVDLEHGQGWAVTHVGAEALYLAAVLAAATAYRNNVRWRSELTARLAADEHEREQTARRRRAEERVEIARDLHDVVSHTLAVVGVHLNVAIDAFDDDRAEARQALRLAQEVRNRAMLDLRALVEVLRDGSWTDQPAGELSGLERLAEQVRGAGLEVSVTEDGDRQDVPAPVATAVYRVVQEALTNTVRHAGADSIAVRLHYRPTEVRVEVIDDGRGSAGPEGAGHGIAGMRERVAALGGSLTIASEHGFAVRATIPMSR
ncbi:sensor histidine kinase [Actinoplanes sp. NPDC049265]|uniref:sensor histidine kinase n=1 Tax=Actinoplanes sp. NPDC049265 TaxID=3363902 RepID=UPI00371A2657